MSVESGGPGVSCNSYSAMGMPQTSCGQTDMPRNAGARSVPRTLFPKIEADAEQHHLLSLESYSLDILYIRIYVCVYRNMHIYAYVYVCVCRCVYIYIFMHLYTYTREPDIHTC